MDINTSTVGALHLGDPGCAACSCKVRVRQISSTPAHPTSTVSTTGLGQELQQRRRRCSRLCRGGEFLAGLSYQNQVIHIQEPASLRNHLILQMVNAPCMLKLLLHLFFAEASRERTVKASATKPQVVLTTLTGSQCQL